MSSDGSNPRVGSHQNENTSDRDIRPEDTICYRILSAIVEFAKTCNRNRRIVFVSVLHILSVVTLVLINYYIVADPKYEEGGGFVEFWIILISIFDTFFWGIVLDYMFKEGGLSYSNPIITILMKIGSLSTSDRLYKRKLWFYIISFDILLREVIGYTATIMMHDADVLTDNFGYLFFVAFMNGTLIATCGILIIIGQGVYNLLQFCFKECCYKPYFAFNNLRSEKPTTPEV